MVPPSPGSVRHPSYPAPGSAPVTGGNLSEVSLVEFTDTPLTPNCARVFDSGVHVVVGVSLGNSYFNGDVLRGLLRWLHVRFETIDIVVPDSSYHDNLLVAGHPAAYAKRKTTRETVTARSRILRSWQQAGIGAPGAEHLHLLSGLAGDAAYRSLRAQVVRGLAEDAELRRCCLEMSASALRSQLRGAEPSPGQVEAGLGYLEAELPFFLGSADVFGVASSLCFYHRPIPVAELLFARGGSLRPPPSQGYALIRPAHEAGPVPAEGEVQGVRS
ncbi:tRNA-dependent cyclodipeptide synthase [Streptomyces sp. CMB-StM0423]|nr:tRNA-dependent cyclodipeptide synthase [Streptomyces sp. CMB-StM0423]